MSIAVTLKGMANGVVTESVPTASRVARTAPKGRSSQNGSWEGESALAMTQSHELKVAATAG
jgi:hypothetical protein